MALYEYECKKCGVVEVEHPISSPAIMNCPKCGILDFKRVIPSSTSFVLKGDGWAKDMYASTKAGGK